MILDTDEYERPTIDEGTRFVVRKLESLGELQAVPEIAENCYGCVAESRMTMCSFMPACARTQLIFVPVAKLDEYRAARVAFKLTGEIPE